MRVGSVYIINTGFDKNISHLLNCHLWSASELKQVAMVAPSR